MIELNIYEEETFEYCYTKDVTEVPKVDDELDGQVITVVKKVNDNKYTIMVQY